MKKKRRTENEDVLVYFRQEGKGYETPVPLEDSEDQNKSLALLAEETT